MIRVEINESDIFIQKHSDIIGKKDAVARLFA